LTVPEIQGAHVHDAACSCSLIGSFAARSVGEKIKEKARHLSPQMVKRMLREALADIAPEIAMDAPPAQVAKRLGMDAEALAKVQEAVVKSGHHGCDGNESANFMLRFMFLSQNFETTADRHAIIREGKPESTQLVDYMLNSHAYNTQESSKEVLS